MIQCQYSVARSPLALVNWLFLLVHSGCLAEPPVSSFLLDGPWANIKPSLSLNPAQPALSSRRAKTAQYTPPPLFPPPINLLPTLSSIPGSPTNHFVLIPSSLRPPSILTMDSFTIANLVATTDSHPTNEEGGGGGGTVYCVVFARAAEETPADEEGGGGGGTVYCVVA
ncbi:hypothetical protein BDZ94DRAFT_1320455 [Collybia nuda]|uniref:Uncharacterized protein n=1 Tax=Collybia nuda TaxID=64659 RepID=A0A9P5YA78_9AGAR|nr:hypothetical protein BDZ94DRAFT_1320455 [Collybia nuda]